MPKGKKDPHYRLEIEASDLPVALTAQGFRPVAAKDADRFSTRLAATLASAGQPLVAVRVDA